MFEDIYCDITEVDRTFVCPRILSQFHSDQCIFSVTDCRLLQSIHYSVRFIIDYV